MKYVPYSIFLFLIACPLFCQAQSAVPCPRFDAGSLLQEPENLYSKNGSLEVSFSYQTRLDSYGNTLYRFVNLPTEHSRPRFTFTRAIISKFTSRTNLTPNGTVPSVQSMPEMAVMGSAADACGSMMMNSLSVNIHAHGTNLPPVCHQDEVMKTLVNAGESFDYDMHFPTDEPLGLYWYHPHVHGIAEPPFRAGPPAPSSSKASRT